MEMKLDDKANRARSAFSLMDTVMSARGRGGGSGEKWLDRSAIAVRIVMKTALRSWRCSLHHKQAATLWRCRERCRSHFRTNRQCRFQESFIWIPAKIFAPNHRDRGKQPLQSSRKIGEDAACERKDENEG